MKAFKITVLAAAVMVGSFGMAQAADSDVPVDSGYDAFGIYLRADAGWSFLDWTVNDNAPVIGGGIGYQMNDYLRTDVRADWAGNYDVAPGSDMSLTTVTGNLYFDWANDTAFTPYIGAGLGWGWANIDNAADDNGFTYSLMAGVAMDLTESVAIDVGYRMRETMISGENPLEHQVLGGVRFSF
jgi:opacity protein-like surface antigen